MAWHREQRARRGTSGNGARILNLKSMAKARRAAAQPARMRVSTSDEQQLIQRILDGETELFHELVRPCARMVFCVCQSVLRNRDDAEDAAQEAMLKAFKNLSRFRAESKFSTWLVAIALNEARARLPDRRVSSFDSHEYSGREEEYRQTNRGASRRERHAARNSRAQGSASRTSHGAGKPAEKLSPGAAAAQGGRAKHRQNGRTFGREQRRCEGSPAARAIDDAQKDGDAASTACELEIPRRHSVPDMRRLNSLAKISCIFSPAPHSHRAETETFPGSAL